MTIIAMLGSSLIATSANQKMAHVELLFLPLRRLGNAVELTPLPLTCYVHAKARERERKREEADGGRREGERRPTRAERRGDRKKSTCMQLPPVHIAEVRHPACVQTEEKEKAPRVGPQKRRRRRRRGEGGGEGEGGRERTRKRRSPGPKTAKEELPHSHKEIHTKTHTQNQRKHRQHKARSSLPNTLRKNVPYQNRTPKPRLRKGELFSSPFSGLKKGSFEPINLPKKPRTPIPKFVAKNPPTKNLR